MKAVLYPFALPDPAQQLAQDFPDIAFAAVASAAEADAHLGDAEILLLSNRSCTAEFGAVLRRHAQSGPLRWIHFTSAGLDRGIQMGLPANLLISSSSGAKAPVIAEHAMTLLLACLRRLPEMRRAQVAHRWIRQEINREMASLEDATVCILGLGAVGLELARKLKAFDAHPIGVTRGRSDAPVERVFSRAELTRALAQSDALVIATNADESSRALIGAVEIAALKPGGVIVNIARGSIIDQPALIAALASGHVAAAGLDVVATEPMPPDCALWDMPNVVITPHVAGGGTTGYARLREIFRENLVRLAGGQPLLNQYSPAASS